MDGQAFLPHARDLLQAEERAAASVRPGRRPLRVDVISRRIAPAALLRGFHRAHPETELDVATLFDADTAIAAVRSGAIDATFRAVTVPARQLPHGIRATRVLDEPHQLLTGPAHELASARTVTLGPARRAPDLDTRHGGRDRVGGLLRRARRHVRPLHRCDRPQLRHRVPAGRARRLAADLASLVGEQTRLLWPADYGLRRIAVRDPTPVYPHSLIWRNDNPHPALATLRDYLAATRPRQRGNGTWAPGWAQD